MTNFLLQTKNLTKYFKNQKVINNVSLNIRESTIYGLLGLNGAGKSTVLKMIIGMINPTNGKILFQDRDIKQSDLLKIGAMIETPAIYGNLTAYENLKIHTLLLSIDEKKINEVLEIVGISKTGKKLASKFSLGMKQRLGIAIALINNPKLLILDEPTNGLDPMGIIEFRNLIKLLSKQGVTVIISSHILSEISQIADDIGIINNGTLAYEKENNINENNLEYIFTNIVKKS
mgnify:CR=1 FL=1